MPITNNTCICGKPLPLPAGSHDAKCEACGRVYNQHGVFLWRERPGKELTGENTGEGEGDRRSPDQDAAIEQAFAEGALPEEPRRATDAAELAGAATGDGAEVAAAATTTTPATTPPSVGTSEVSGGESARGEHTHRHEKGAGHKPFTRSKR